MTQKCFETIYYLNVGAPNLYPTLPVAKCYTSAGCRHLQLDLPSRNPYLEHDQIKMRMAESLAACGDYAVYLDALSDLRDVLPEVQLEMTVYQDTLEEIGIDPFLVFCNGMEVSHLALLPKQGGDTAELSKLLRAAGVKLLQAIPFDLPADAVATAVAEDRPVQLMTHSDKPPRKGCETLEKAIAWLREQGVKEIYVTMGIRTPERLAEVRQAGADGAYIGSCLMDAWGDERELSRRIAAFERAVCERGERT